jgi:hypothetical protein
MKFYYQLFIIIIAASSVHPQSAWEKIKKSLEEKLNQKIETEVNKLSGEDGELISSIDEARNTATGDTWICSNTSTFAKIEFYADNSCKTFYYSNYKGWWSLNNTMYWKTGSDNYGYYITISYYQDGDNDRWYFENSKRLNHNGILWMKGGYLKELLPK